MAGLLSPKIVSKEILDRPRERNLEPFVTLHHFTNPHWFAKRGGWLHADAAATFARFAARAARALPSVRYWITINEPTVYVKNGYTAGTWPPFRRGAWSAAASVLMNMARAHVEAYHALHAALSGVQVGFAHSAPYVEPCAFGGMPARIAARSRDFLLNDCFFLLLKLAARRRRIRQILDFIGTNYYTRTRVHRDRGFAGLVFGKECREAHHSDRGADNELGWEIYPPGLAKIVCRFASHGLPIFVTENGIATSNDEQRAQFIVDHLRVLAEACESGVDLRGYFHWTLTDNYEWSHGTTAHFGLAGVEPETFARVPRRSALLYAEICRTNGATLREQEGP